MANCADYRGKIGHAGSQVVQAPAAGETKKGKRGAKTETEEKTRKDRKHRSAE